MSREHPTFLFERLHCGGRDDAAGDQQFDGRDDNFALRHQNTALESAIPNSDVSPACGFRNRDRHIEGRNAIGVEVLAAHFRYFPHKAREHHHAIVAAPTLNFSSSHRIQSRVVRSAA